MTPKIDFSVKVCLMKKALILLGIILSLNVFAGAGDVRPLPNECSPLPATKRYLSKDFHDYPRTVNFECTYECNVDNSIHFVNAVSKVKINNIDEDALMTTCQGVLVKKTKWGYDFDKIVPFYAADTSLIELKKWALDNIDFNPAVNSLEKSKLTQLKSDLNQVGAAYIVAGTTGGEATRYFIEAGQTLVRIAEGLPLDTKALDGIINNLNGPSKNSAAALVESMLKSAASWRIPAN